MISGIPDTQPDTVGAASDSCQRWRDRSHSWRRTSDGGFNPRLFDVGPLDELVAKSFVETHHYSRAYPAAVKRFGLYQSGCLVGVAILSSGIEAALRHSFPSLAPYAESLELGRFVLLDEVPANAETWFLARAFDLAAAEGVRGVVSFSDPMPRTARDGRVVFAGHVGHIYQCANATYTGRTRPETFWLLPDARLLAPRALSKIRNGESGRAYVERRLVEYGAEPIGERDPREWLEASLAAIDARRVRHPGQHRYLFALGGRLKRRYVRVALPSLPYPHRDQHTFETKEAFSGQLRRAG
jgi:hypothetical protein